MTLATAIVVLITGLLIIETYMGTKIDKKHESEFDLKLVNGDEDEEDVITVELDSESVCMVLGACHELAGPVVRITRKECDNTIDIDEQLLIDVAALVKAKRLDG
jgi:predicted RNA-binding protein